MTATVQPTFTLHNARSAHGLIAPKIAEAHTQRGLDAIESVYRAAGIRTYPVRWSSHLDLGEASQ